MIEIQPIVPEDIPEIMKLVSECWKDYFAGTSEALLYAACGMIVRNNYLEPDLSFKAIENGKIVAIVFAGTADSVSHPEKFYEDRLSVLEKGEGEWLKTQRAYHIKADTECKKLLDDTTFKLALFMSTVKGSGRLLLDHLIGILQEKGYKRMALWTDTSCSYDYYPSHGFTQQSSLKIPEYSTPDEDYVLMTFTKEI